MINSDPAITRATHLEVCQEHGIKQGGYGVEYADAQTVGVAEQQEASISCKPTHRGQERLGHALASFLKSPRLARWQFGLLLKH